jgi:hypothetical protein
VAHIEPTLRLRSTDGRETVVLAAYLMDGHFDARAKRPVVANTAVARDLVAALAVLDT